MAEYKICPRCNGKGYTHESNMTDEGIIGIFYDLIEGWNRVRCNACLGSGRIKVKD